MNNYLFHSVDAKTREAIWQFLMDHASMQPNGYWHIDINVTDEENLWNRIQSRYDGRFKRYDLAEKMSMKMIDIRKHYYYTQKLNDKRNKIIQSIESGHNIFKKVVLFLYRKTRHNLYGD